MEQFGSNPEALDDDRFNDPADRSEPALEFTPDTFGKNGTAKGGKAHVAAIDEEDLSKPLSPTFAEGHGLLKFFPPTLRDMARAGVNFTLDNSGAVTVNGFYKRGPLSLEIGDDDALTAIDRRGQRHPIGSYDDLVTLNYRAWIQSNTRGESCAPERPWLDAFIAKNWVKRQVIFVPRDPLPTVDGE
ncbi:MULTISPECIES: hypothetical protein [Burkholderia]|uniref:hypothetical protein n=1 Tax=Burkholderia TaxID=32008 RepID=UPI00030BB4C7|nr:MULTISPECIES: hypothetical protein [Burkholderia]MBJ9920664.1 hypothetical protein [Burkholderia cenocepacia]UVS90920.1 hypothetical protein EFP17_14755 [Burkholderia glumae]